MYTHMCTYIYIYVSIEALCRFIHMLIHLRICIDIYYIFIHKHYLWRSLRALWSFRDVCVASNLVERLASGLDQNDTRKMMTLAGTRTECQSCFFKGGGSKGGRGYWGTSTT